jgi:hypothetical protein
MNKVKMSGVTPKQREYYKVNPSIIRRMFNSKLGVCELKIMRGGICEPGNTWVSLRAKGVFLPEKLLNIGRRNVPMAERYEKMPSPSYYFSWADHYMRIFLEQNIIKICSRYQSQFDGPSFILRKANTLYVRSYVHSMPPLGMWEYNSRRGIWALVGQRNVFTDNHYLCARMVGAKAPHEGKLQVGMYSWGGLHTDNEVESQNHGLTELVPVQI